MARRSPGARFGGDSLRVLASELPTRSIVPLAVAIFALFSVLGPVSDLFDGGREPLTAVARNSALAGLIALGDAFGSLRRNYGLFPGTIVLQVTWGGLSARFSPPPGPAGGSR